MARCPECAGKMKYNPDNRLMVCGSCGLSLSRYELDHYWSNIRDERKSKEEKKNY